MSTWDLEAEGEVDNESKEAFNGEHIVYVHME